MDSLTHIALGAAIGEVTLGSKIGNKALVYGAFLGSIPDLDVFISPFLNSVSSLFFHRGLSHSFFFNLILIPILVLIISWIEKKQLISTKSWFLFTLLPLFSHIIIDCFNTYGTGIFEPFNNIRVSYDSIAIIDLLFLLPLTISLMWLLFLKKENRLRRIITWTGISISTLYFFFTILNKNYIEVKIKEQLVHQNIKYNRLLTTPVPLSNFLWMIVAENDNGYNIGYYCNFNKKDDVKFRYLARNAELLGNLKETKEVKKLILFAKGYYSVEKDMNGNLCFHDLRYGSLDYENDNAYVFTFKINSTPNGVNISRSHPNRSINLKTINKFLKRTI